MGIFYFAGGGGQNGQFCEWKIDSQPSWNQSPILHSQKSSAPNDSDSNSCPHYVK